MKVLKYLFIFTHFCSNIFSDYIYLFVDEERKTCFKSGDGEENRKIFRDEIRENYVKDNKFDVLAYLTDKWHDEETIDPKTLFFYNAYLDYTSIMNKAGDISADFLKKDEDFTIYIHALTEKAVDKIKNMKTKRYGRVYESGVKWITSNVPLLFFELVGDLKKDLLERGDPGLLIKKRCEEFILEYILKDEGCVLNHNGNSRIYYCPNDAHDDTIETHIYERGYRFKKFVDEDNIEVVPVIDVAHPVNLEFIYDWPKDTAPRDEFEDEETKTRLGEDVYGDSCFFGNKCTEYVKLDKKDMTPDNIKRVAAKLMQTGEYSEYIGSTYYLDRGVEYDVVPVAPYSKDNIYKFKVHIPERSERLKSFFIKVDFSRGEFASDKLNKLNGLYVIHEPNFGEDEGKTNFIEQLKARRGDDTTISDDCINDLANAFCSTFKKDEEKVEYYGYGMRDFSESGRVFQYINNESNAKTLKSYFNNASGGTGGGAGGTGSGSDSPSESGKGTKSVNLSRPVKKKNCCCDCCTRCCR